jgi:hypothetical protein
MVGFAWSRQSLQMLCVGKRKRKIGEEKRGKNRITVRKVTGNKV